MCCKEQGVYVRRVLFEHFNYTRQELFDLVKIHQHTTYTDVLHYLGQGCEICKPLVASVLASLRNGHIPEQDRGMVQDTADRFPGNIQKGRTYVAVPQIPGGEIIPDKLIVTGKVAKKYNLYSTITGGQRVDSHLHDLPLIWQELMAAGVESGHAYGKSLRTVKSCVGSTWCHFGVQDFVSFPIEGENRYKGLSTAQN